MKLKHITFIFTTLLCICLLASVAKAQRGQTATYSNPINPSVMSTPVYIGPTFGINMLGHSMTVKTFDDDLLCPTFNGASGTGFFAGISVEYLLGKNLTTSNSSIIARILYNTYPGSTTIDGDRYPSAVPGTDEIIYSTTNHQLDIDYNVATLDLMYKINPIPAFNIGIVLGPSFDYTLSQNLKQTQNLIEPDNAQFKDVPAGKYVYENNMRTRVIQDGEIDGASSFRVGIKGGVQYELIFSKLCIVPSVCYNFGITNFNTDYDWRVSPLQIGLDIRYTFAF